MWQKGNSSEQNMGTESTSGTQNGMMTHFERKSYKEKI